jgi:hypothetical protein
MYVAFDQLGPQARVWIYQASRPFTADEVIKLLPRIAQFAEQWTSHGRALLASAEILHHQFLVIGLDEGRGGASGCSIDASVRFVQEIERLLDLELLEKTQLAFMRSGEVWLLDRRELKAAVASGELSPETLYFDNTLATKQEIMRSWPVPAGNTWLAKYFVQEEKN